MAEKFDDTMFLVEIRLGRTKWRIKRNTAAIVRRFGIEEFAERHPHITLFGPFTVKDGVSVNDLKKAVEDAARPYGPVPFLIHGYDSNQGLNGAVIAYRVVPSDELAGLAESVAASVGRLAETFNPWDLDPDQKWFHVTIANRLGRETAMTIFWHLGSSEPNDPDPAGQDGGFFRTVQNPSSAEKDGGHEITVRPPFCDEDGLRITIVRGDTILSEYDLDRHCWFSPESATAAADWQQTLEQYRKKRGIELVSPVYRDKKEIFVISDLHLGHANIIRYCSRPFPHNAVEEMDRVLIKNWNYTVRPGQKVFHIGDLCYGRYARHPSEYLQRLNGTISLVRGNHDSGVKTAARKERLVYQEIPFILVHDPDDAAGAFPAWVIHGHHHNNDLEHYPFINFEKRRINVSAEVVRYRPVSLSDLCTIITEHQLKPRVKSLLLYGSEAAALS